jgi:hypothetical protein
MHAVIVSETKDVSLILFFPVVQSRHSLFR